MRFFNIENVKARLESKLRDNFHDPITLEIPEKDEFNG